MKKLLLVTAIGLTVAGDVFAQQPTIQAPSRTISFAERVAHQRAIEEVFWRHRVWPKENAGSKPPLDRLLAPEQIEQRVEDYLRKSQALDDKTQRPLTAEQLQAEMERMAQQTKQPEVLRELFAALGNDPFVIAECLARPALADRSIAARDESKGEGVNAVAAPGGIYTLPPISDETGGCNDAWMATPTQGMGRDRHTIVWTGAEMIVWGGEVGLAAFTNTGARYRPSIDSWAATTTTNAPNNRADLTAVWTGTEMIVWGGDTPGVWFNTGGRYNPAADTWTATSTANAPQARQNQTAVWTGREMVVWGGLFYDPPNVPHYVNTGGRYNPTTDSWAATNTANAPQGRDSHTAVWTGTEMIVWGGGIANSQWVNTGGRYNPATDSWAPTSLLTAPLARAHHTAVWTGNEMVMWGGFTFSNQTDTGGRYNPSTDNWTATSTTDAPTRRYNHTAVWTGTEMIVWGGFGCIGSPMCQGETYLGSGARYSVNTDSWVATTASGAPVGREPTAVWTGNRMIVWGGYFHDNTDHWLNTGASYCAQPSTPLVQSAVSRRTHGTSGDFDIDLPLTGSAGIECRSGGATGDYTIVLTFLANVSVQGSPQATVTAGNAVIGRNGVSNGGAVVTAGNVVSIPLTNVANAQTIAVTLNNVNGSTNVTIPMSILVGDVNGNGAVNATDIGLAKSRSGLAADATNFRADANGDGNISASDVSLVKAQSGTALP
jgi:N-acetylneuraminic acid mutarotase